MVIQPYLAFTGNCEEALNFYKSVLGGEISFMMRHGDSPMKDQVSREWHQKVMHATFTADGASIMACDRPPGMPGPTGFCGITLSIAGKDLSSSEAIHKALAEGGQVTMPFSPTFWAKGFGMLVDKYGVSWMVNCE
jgi:PhnB protein